MKKIILALSLISTPYLLSAQDQSRMDIRQDQIGKWITTHFGRGHVPPFSFTYNGKSSQSFIRNWEHNIQEIQSGEPGERKYEVKYTDPQSRLEVACIIKGYTDYGAVDWVLRFTNKGSSNTKPVANINTCDLSLGSKAEGPFTIHYSFGSNAVKNDFAPMQKTLSGGDSLHMRPNGGRSSDTAFPFFNIEGKGNAGTIVAIGWSGTWQSTIKTLNKTTVKLTCGLESFNAYLLPGESIRAASVCLLFWKGSNSITGNNRFRRFLIAHHTRKIDGKAAEYPICGGFNWGDPTPCEEYTCMTSDYAKALIQRYKLFRLDPEVYWLDAGWYEHSDEWYNKKGWYNTTGNWIPDSTRFPQGLREVSDAAHKAGGKLMVWFEPERVAAGSQWSTLDKEWLMPESKDNFLLDLGNNDANSFLCRYIGDLLEKEGIDYYRQDFNISPESIWKKNDREGREGITEVKYIEGLYKYWDYLLNRFPHLLIDNCASGGRRIDYETVARSAPLWRTDYNFGDDTGYQCQTYGIQYFLPFNGTGCYTADRYHSRGSFSSAVVFNWKLTQNDISYLEMQRVVKEYQDIRPYFYEDYYPLSGIENTTKDNIWLAYELYRPSDETGYLVAFRRKNNKDRNYTVKLGGLNPDKTYILRNCDSDEEIKKTGKQLSTGLTLTSDRPETCLLYKISVVGKAT